MPAESAIINSNERSSPFSLGPNGRPTHSKLRDLNIKRPKSDKLAWQKDWSTRSSPGGNLPERTFWGWKALLIISLGSILVDSRHPSLNLCVLRWANTRSQQRHRQRIASSHTLFVRNSAYWQRIADSTLTMPIRPIESRLEIGANTDRVTRSYHVWQKLEHQTSCTTF